MPLETDSPLSDRSRRNWLSFRLRTLFLVVTVVSIAAAYPHIYRRIQFQRFQSFVDQDIRSLPESERVTFSNIADDLLPAAEHNYFGARGPYWHVWRMSTYEGPRFALFHGPAVIEHPGILIVYVHLFDLRGNWLGESALSMGWRTGILDMSVATNEIQGESIFRIDTDHMFMGGKPETWYFGIVDEQVALLRLEDDNQNLVRSVVAWPNQTFQGTSVKRSEVGWIRALNSDRHTELLHALAWIGGKHSPKDEYSDDSSTAEIALDESIAKVRENPAAKAAVTSLIESENVWIAEAARLALQTMLTPQVQDHEPADYISP